MLASSTMTGRGIRSQEGRVGVPVHRCEYAHDEGKGIMHYKGTLREGTAPHHFPREMVVVSGREGMLSHTSPLFMPSRGWHL
jgi:hypothetical protein